MRLRIGCVTGAFLQERINRSGLSARIEIDEPALLSGRGGRFVLDYREMVAAPVDGAELAVHFFQLAISDPQTGAEILAFHIHDGDPRSHYHLGAGAGALLAPLYKAHIPAGELDERAFIRMLIADFGVRPLRRNWRTVLETG